MKHIRKKQLVATERSILHFSFSFGQQEVSTKTDKRRKGSTVALHAHGKLDFQLNN